MADGPERRQYPRLTVPMLYRPAGLFGPRKPARDVSLGGVRVLTDEAFAPGQRLEIELFLQDGRSFTVAVRVAWIAPHGEPAVAAHEAGLEFLGLSPEKAELLEQCVAPQ